MVLLARGSVTVTAVNDGVPEKLYRAWSNNADGSGFSTTDSNRKYLGTYVGLSEPTLASQYKWTLIKGETGETGQPGVSAYLHTAWANSANGQTGFSTSVSTDKLYIGTYSSSSPTPSQVYTSYKWVRVKGLDAKFYSVIVDKSFLNRNGLSSTATETIAINSYVHQGNSAGVAAPGFFIIKEQIKQTTGSTTTYVFQEKHRSTTAVSQLNYTVSANAVTVKIEFYLTNQFNNLFAVRDIGVLMDASTDIEARVPIAQLIENINNHPSTTLISGAKLRFTSDVTFDKSFHTKLFAETGFIENLSAYEFSADNIKTGTLSSANGMSTMNLNTGAFSFAGGKLKYDGTTLSVTGSLTVDSFAPALKTSFNGKVDTSKLANSGQVTIHGGNITAGTLDAGKITTGTLDASKVTVTNLTADNITSGTLEADYIKGGTLDFDLLHAENFSANNLTSGTIDANIVNINNLSASRIKTGNLDVSSGLKITSGNHQIMSIDPETLNLEFNVNKMSIGGVKLISEDDQPQMEQNIATELEGKIKPYLHIAYANNATGTSGFSISDSLNKLYIGTYTNYISTQSTDPSKYKWALIKGEKGTTGVGLQSITEWYLATPLKEGVTRTTSGWKNSVQTLSSVNNYLWNYEQVNYDNGTKQYTDPTIIGTFGEQGISVKGVTEYYLASPLSQGITKDTPGWTTDIQPLTPENKYLWNKEIVHYSDDAAFLDKTEILSGNEIFTNKANDNAVVHVEIDGKSYQHAGSGKNLLGKTYQTVSGADAASGYGGKVYSEIENGYRITNRWTAFGWKIMLKPSVKYTISGKLTMSNTENKNERVYVRINYHIGTTVDGVSFTVATNERFSFTFTSRHDDVEDVIAFATYSSESVSTVFDITDIQLEESSVVTSYEPPAPTPDYPVEIHSLNDFDIVSSVGRRNLLEGSDKYDKKKYARPFDATVETTNDLYGEWNAVKIIRSSSSGFCRYFNYDANGQRKNPYLDSGVHTFSFWAKSESEMTLTYGIRDVGIYTAHIGTEWKRVSVEIPTGKPEGVSADGEFWWGQGSGGTVVFSISHPKLEKGYISTSWTIAPEDIQSDTYTPTLHKINLLLDEPLRSVGDVKDRLFRDTDGLWKIERNVKEYTFTGNENFGANAAYGAYYISGDSLHDETIIGASSNCLKPSSGLSLLKGEKNAIGLAPNTRAIRMSIVVDGVQLTHTTIKPWLVEKYNSGNPLIIQYLVEAPIIRTLPQSLQDKLNNLRTFKDSNYIYTVLPDKSNILSENLEPTLHATFKSKAWAGNFAGHPSIIGVYGDSAKLLYLSTSADSMTFNSDGSANPASQTITFTGNLQNVLGNVIFTAIAYNGTTVVSTISLSGVGNTRTLTQAQFPASADRIQVKATLGNLEDTVTIVKLKNGADAIVGYLTNESVTLSANNAGTVSSFTSASGTFKVFEGTIDRTSSTDTSFRVKTQTGAVATINSSSGVYGVSSMSSDSANIVFEATYKNIKIDQTLSLSKSKEGIKGIPGPQGVSITKVDVQYYLSTSNTSQTGGSWSTTAPAWIDGRFMWSKTVTTYTSGSPTESKPVCITGAKGTTGSTGSTGATGRGISSIVEQFYLSTSKTTQTGGSWSATMPTWSPGKYVWTRSLITYTTGTPATSTTEPLVSSEWEAINEIEIGGRNLLTGTSESEQEVKTSSWSLGGWNPSLTVGEEYTFSFDIKSENATYLENVFLNNSNNGFIPNTPVSKTWTRVSVTFKWKGGTYNGIEFAPHIYPRPNYSGTYVSRIKLEKGNKATDWSPATEDIEAAYTAVAQAKAEAERVKAEAYADGKVTAEEQARIKDADAKLAAAKKYAVDQILADKTIKDTRNDNQTPSWYYTNHPRRTIKEFKLTTTIGVVSSEGTYGILETEIPWTDASGGPVKQTFRVNSKTFKRSGTTTSWSSWVSYDDIAEKAKSDAATAKGIADGAASSASTANSLLSDIASDSKLTATEKKAAKKEWDIIVGEKPKIDSSADTYGITTQKTAYNTAYNALNTYLSSLLANLNTTSNIVGTTFRTNFKNYYNARQDLLNKIADGAKSLVDDIEIGGRNLLLNSQHVYLAPNNTGLGNAVLMHNETTPYYRVTGNSTISTFGDDANATSSMFSEPMINGTTYTVSVDVRAPRTGRVGLYAGRGTQALSKANEWVRIKHTYTYIGTSFRVLGLTYDSSIIDYRNWKIEKGNIATDWTPAPEDIQDQIDDKASNESVTEVSTSLNSNIEIAMGEIRLQASETYVEKSALDTYKEEISTKFTQTSASFDFSFNELVSRVNSIGTEAKEDIQNITKYIRFVDGKIVLGETNNQLVLQIGNDKISFLQYGSEVAYFSNNKLFITDVEVLNSIKIGNFAFLPRANGSLDFKKI